MHNEFNAPSAATTSPAPAPARIPGAAFVMKTCRTCGEEKPVRAFYKQQGCAERYRLDCIPCVKVELKNRRTRQLAEAAPDVRWCRHCRASLPIAEFPKDRRCRAGHALICQTCQDRIASQKESARENLNCADKWIPHFSPLREERIDLGIAIAHATCPPGHCRSREEIAAYAGLTVEAVRRIELRALWKMRARARKILADLGLEQIMEEGIRL